MNKEHLSLVIKKLQEIQSNSNDECEIAIDTGLKEIGYSIDGRVYYKKYINIYIDYNEIIIKNGGLQ